MLHDKPTQLVLNVHYRKHLSLHPVAMFLWHMPEPA